jgi:hypothetical protein
MLLSNQIGVRARLLLAVLLMAALLLLLIPAHSVFAANPPGSGQPHQSCENVGVRPGNAITAPGSAFNPAGVAGTKYAGEQPQNSKNPSSVSQYDVACFQVSQH